MAKQPGLGLGLGLGLGSKYRLHIPILLSHRKVSSLGDNSAQPTPLPSSPHSGHPHNEVSDLH